jgi:Uma2 family endonuclease
MSTDVIKRLFTVRDFHRMVDAGILAEHDRVELIRGEVITMSPIGPPHSAIVDRITRAMVRAAGDEAIVRVQSNVELSEYNEPEPDIVLMRPRDDFYYSALPAPADIFLIVEVSDSSIRYDRGLKAELYAETGVPEYWVVDVKNRQVFAYSDPQGQEYRAVREFSSGDVVSPRLLPNCSVSVASMVG